MFDLRIKIHYRCSTDSDAGVMKVVKGEFCMLMVIGGSMVAAVMFHQKTEEADAMLFALMLMVMSEQIGHIEYLRQFGVPEQVQTNQ